MRHSHFMPFLLAGLLIMVWPTSYPLAKLCLNYFTPEAMVSMRMVVAGVVMTGYILFYGHQFPSRADLPRFFACGLLGVLGFAYFIGLASRQLPAGEVSFLVAINPLYMVVRQLFTGEEKVTARLVIGSLVSIGGLAMITLLNTEIRWNFSMVYALLSGACFSAGLMVQKPLLSRYPMTMVGAWLPVMAGVGALPMFATHVHELGEQTHWQGIAIILFLAIISTGVAFLIWAYLVHHLKQTQAAGIGYFLPFSASISAMFILGEHMPLTSWLGGLGIVLGSVISHSKWGRQRCAMAMDAPQP